MFESITIKSTGKTILFYSTLSKSGIVVTVKKKQFDLPEEKNSFEKQLKAERDVVTIIYT